MRGGDIHNALVVRAPNSLLARAGLAHTFGGLAAFLVLTFFCVGTYILDDAFANPLNTGASAVICAAFIITLAAVLLYFLVKPGKRTRTVTYDSPCPLVPLGRSSLSPTAGAGPRDHPPIGLAYQRFYVDNSRIRP